MYSIRYETDAHILHLRLSGFWDADTLTRFTAELLVRITSLKIGSTSYGLLSNSIEFPVQSPLVATGLGCIMENDIEMHQRPTAIVVAGYLSKMQVERTLKGDRLRVFLNESNARDWLAAEMAKLA